MRPAGFSLPGVPAREGLGPDACFPTVGIICPECAIRLDRLKMAVVNARGREVAMQVEEARRNLLSAARRMRMGELEERLRGRDAAGTIARAKAVLADAYSFSKPWDMERCATPFTVPVDALTGTYDWNVVMNDDPEWCFMLNRMDYLADLAVAALVTGERRYSDKAVALMVGWARTHDPVTAELSTRTLDTGIRLLAMAQVLPALVWLDAISDDELVRVVGCIEAQIAYLPGQYINKYETSNWGSIQTLAVISALCLLRDDPTTHPVWGWAMERMESQMAAQVYPDGVDWELSTMYHIEVLLYSMRGSWALQSRGLAVPSVLEGAVRRLAYALLAQRLPDGTIDAEGDSDRCRITGVLALAAAVLGDPALKAGARGTGLDLSDLSEYGCALEDAYLTLDVCDVVGLPRTFDGGDAGLFVARSSWDRDANQAIFLNGPLGSGHGHADNLHLSAAWRGRLVLADSGRYTYREDSPVRPRLKGVAAHNVPIIDGKPASVPKGSWGYAGFCFPLKTYVRHDDDIHYWEGALVGRDPLQVIMRRVVFVERGIWLVCDEAWADGMHELGQRFHLEPSLEATPEDGAGLGGRRARSSLRPGSPELARGWVIDAGAGKLALSSTADSQVVRDECSPDYNVLVEQDVVETKTAFEGRGTAVSCLRPRDVKVESVPVLRNLEEPVGPDLAQAWRFTLPMGEAYTVAVFHEEVHTGVKAFSLESVSFHAKVVVVRTQADGSRKLTVLRA